jgi:hypothetical protein
MRVDGHLLLAGCPPAWSCDLSPATSATAVKTTGVADQDNRKRPVGFEAFKRSGKCLSLRLCTLLVAKTYGQGWCRPS